MTTAMTADDLVQRVLAAAGIDPELLADQERAAVREEAGRVLNELLPGGQAWAVVLGTWKTYCTAATGLSNEWLDRGQRYRWEIGSVQPDGSLTGRVQRWDGDVWRTTASGWRIDPDGRVQRAPAPLLRAVAGVGPVPVAA